MATSSLAVLGLSLSLPPPPPFFPYTENVRFGFGIIRLLGLSILLFFLSVAIVPLLPIRPVSALNLGRTLI